MLKRTAAVVVLAIAMLAPASPAFAGTTWNNLSGVAVSDTNNGTTWSSFSVPRCASLPWYLRAMKVAFPGSVSCR